MSLWSRNMKINFVTCVPQVSWPKINSWLLLQNTTVFHQSSSSIREDINHLKERYMVKHSMFILRLLYLQKQRCIFDSFSGVRSVLGCWQHKLPSRQTILPGLIQKEWPQALFSSTCNYCLQTCFHFSSLNQKANNLWHCCQRWHWVALWPQCNGDTTWGWEQKNCCRGKKGSRTAGAVSTSSPGNKSSMVLGDILLFKGLCFSPTECLISIPNF